MPSNRQVSKSRKRRFLDSSRRTFLRTAGVSLGVGSLAGCLSDLGLAKTGHLQLKAISLRWDHEGRTYRNESLDLLFDRREKKASGMYDPDFVDDGVSGPDDVTVSQETHERLARRFEVKYLLGVCGSDFADQRGESYGCLNTWTSREDFNRVQLNDRAEVRVSDHRFDVIDVYEDAYAIESADLRTFDFAEYHEEDGLSPERW